MPSRPQPRSSGVQIKREPLTENQINAALLDPTVFIDKYCYIRGKGGTQERFNLWPFQREVVECFDDEERVLILKARQLGISWCADGYALWLCTANYGQSVMILSQGQRESKEEMRRIRFMHERLPPELRRKTGGQSSDSHTPDTTEQLEFPEMDSRIISLPSTEHAGTSFTATLAIIHELAKISTAATLIPAITPTMADGGRMFIVSTAFGFSGTFYEYWQEEGLRWHPGQIVGDKGSRGSFRPVFIPWHARPGRDQAWYNATKAGIKKESMMKQEYPSSPDEAFQGSAESCFAEEFKRNIHAVSGSRDTGSIFEVAHGIDLGINHAFGYLIEIQGASAFVFAEVHNTNDTVSSLGQSVIEADRAFSLDPTAVVSYVDPAGVARNMQTLKTDYDVLKEEGLLVDEQSDKVSPPQRVDLIKKLLKANRLWISLDCPRLLEALEKAQWKRRKGFQGTTIIEDTYEKDGKHEHPLDALGYALCRIFPPIAAAAVETETPPGSDDGYEGAGMGYSGSEFGG